MNSDQIIDFELFTHQELNKFQIFVGKQWNEDHLFAKESSIFDWQYKESDNYNCMVAKKRGSLVGFQGFIPQSHFDDQLPETQIFLALWFVSESQGIGIGLRLYKKIVAEFKPKFLGTLGIDDRVIPFHKWQGFSVGIMNHGVALSPYIDSFRIAEVPVNYKVKSGEITQQFTYNKINIEDLKSLKINGLFSYQWPTKSVTYIINRYSKHPIYSYEIYAVKKNRNLVALFVLRPISIHGRNVLRIVDYCGSNDIISSSYAFFKSMLKKYRAEYIDMYSFGVPLDVLKDAGLINRQHEKGLIIPNYFEPFVKKNIDITYAYKTNDYHPPIRMFKGDGDQDRPAQI